MKKLFFVLILVALLCLPLCCKPANSQGIYPKEGLYSGVFANSPDVITPVGCIIPRYPGYSRFSEYDPNSNTVTYENVLFWMGMEIVLSHVEGCKIAGVTIHIPKNDQIIDTTNFTPPDIPAIITVKASHGIAIMDRPEEGSESISYTEYFSNKTMSCEDENNGENCAYWAERMLGEGGFYPCMITPWATNFSWISD